MDKKKVTRQVVLLLVDIVIITISIALALILRFDMLNIPELYLSISYRQLHMVLIETIIVFYIFRMYSSVWLYASLEEFVNLVIACFLSVALEASLDKFIFGLMPISYYMIRLMIIIILIGMFRVTYRIARLVRRELTEKRKKDHILTMVIGAGDAANMLIKDTMKNPRYKNKIVCLIDDDRNKKGSFVNGVKVVGNRNDIVSMASKYHVDEIIIAMPSAAPNDLKEIVGICKKTECVVKKLPNIYELVGKATIDKVRDISYEDLLGREQVTVEMKEIDNLIKDKVVIVTGGGGSIGSELCRQIALKKPKKLIIIDIYENNAYDIQNELKRLHGNLDLEVLIASVRDYDRMDSIFKKYKPDYVFHAAAHKHVPLMEDSPCESIKNNVLGTLNVAKVSVKYHVKKFILISSDKAVKPTNIMGASKRICEMIIQTYNKMSDTDFVAVRFGNVLGSNGSVIPLFLKQIEQGGPVTVTDKNIIRYFMTIPEAVILIMQAACYATGGEIFILDMGEPVKIYDLACKLIEMKGYIPNKDIKIKITGLRPGEKLYEELLMAEEGIQDTPNKLIHIAKPIEFNETKFLKNLDRLIKDSFKNDSKIKEKVVKITGTYVITPNSKEDSNE